ncbi:transcription factor SUM-1-like [Anneissia japonica]|uniref:transcription factor SUM-1-like n=1 Tax=Anneissia japonica TaxID=1529436 RepID=UPI0014256FC4|nr:transcription factor SUM-1-like [Anneissia japonica]
MFSPVMKKTSTPADYVLYPLTNGQDAQFCLQESGTDNSNATDAYQQMDFRSYGLAEWRYHSKGNSHCNQTSFVLSGQQISQNLAVGIHNCVLNKTSSSADEDRRMIVNARERRRMRKMNEAMDALRRVVPNYPSKGKTSKMETLLLAQTYILALSRLLKEPDRNGDDIQVDENSLAASITDKIDASET